jgi:hypothetical protein
MNDTCPPPGHRPRKQPRPGPAHSPVLASIPQPDHADDGQPGSDDPPALAAAVPRRAQITQAASAKRRWLAVAGTVVPGGTGIAWAIAGRPQPALLLAAALVLATAIPGTVAVMYQARQVTRRREIECHPANTLAAALARIADATHAKAQHLSGTEEARETQRVREAASRVLANLPAFIAELENVLNRPGPSASNHPGD